MQGYSDEVRRISFGAKAVAQQIRAKIAKVIEPYAASRAIFLDEKGEPTAAAIKWLGELSDSCYVERTTFHDRRDEMVRREARRELALEILKSLRLDTATLARLRRQLHEREIHDD